MPLAPQCYDSLPQIIAIALHPPLLTLLQKNDRYIRICSRDCLFIKSEGEGDNDQGCLDCWAALFPFFIMPFPDRPHPHFGIFQALRYWEWENVPEWTRNEFHAKDATIAKRYHPSAFRIDATCLPASGGALRVPYARDLPRLSPEAGSSFILHPSSFILHPSSFILPPFFIFHSSFCLFCPPPPSPPPPDHFNEADK